MPERQSNLRSEAVQDILTAVPSWMIRWGNTLIMVLLMLFFLLSWIIKYPDIIDATALVTTETPPQKEYARVGGKLKHILVSNSEAVIPSQDLAVIENTANYEDILYLKSIIDTLSYTKERFDFPINDIPLLFLGEVDNQFAIFENNYIEYHRNRKLKPFHNKELNQILSQAEIKNRLANLNTQLTIQKKELTFQESDYNRYKSLFDKGVISEQEFEQKELVYLRSRRSFKALVNSISQLRETLVSSSTNYEIEKTNQSGKDIRLIRSVIHSYNQLKKAIYDWESTYVLKSEINGNVSFLDFWSINQQVKPNDLIFTIIPAENDKHIAKLKIPALNSGKIKVGQRVYLELDKYPENEFGKLTSVIHKISAITDESDNYLIDVILDEKLLTTYGKEIPYQSDMLGNANIVTEDLRLLERFFNQLRSIFNN